MCFTTFDVSEAQQSKYWLPDSFYYLTIPDGMETTQPVMCTHQEIVNSRWGFSFYQKLSDDIFIMHLMRLKKFERLFKCFSIVWKNELYCGRSRLFFNILFVYTLFIWLLHIFSLVKVLPVFVDFQGIVSHKKKKILFCEHVLTTSQQKHGNHRRRSYNLDNN